MTEFAAFRPKRQSYLKDDNDENKKARGTRKCVIKQNSNLKTIKIVQKQINLKQK